MSSNNNNQSINLIFNMDQATNSCFKDQEREKQLKATTRTGATE